MKFKNLILAVVIISSVLLVSCSGTSAIETYMTKDIEEIGVEKNMDESGTKLEEILGAVSEKIANGEEVDWDAVSQEIDPVLAGMQETRDKVAQISIKDENVKEINSYLISTYDKLISGYEKLIDGFRDSDEAMINEASDDLTGAQEDIQTWYSLIEAAYKD
jgi:hypothetical protein